MHDDPSPGAVMSPGTSLTKELNLIPNYNISKGHSVHTTMNTN
jgi:hypothetical protein